MKIEALDKICCPFDKSMFKITVVSKDIQHDILEGYLVCETCARIFSIVQGIPILSPDEYRAFDLEKPLLEKWSKNKVNRQFRISTRH